MSARLFQLVRHIEWDRHGNRPTAAGEEQLDTLRAGLAEVLGNGAVILSSAAERALHTSRQLAADIGVLVFPSVRMELGGEYPNGIENLDIFVDRALTEAGASLGEETPLIVVTHKPLIDVVKGDKTAYGDVVPYVPGTWHNPNFLEAYGRGLERQIDAAMAG